MKKVNYIAVLVGMGLAILLWTVPGQAQTVQQAGTPTAAAPAPVPPDQQATKEQLAKLFEVMRIREQVASLTKMLPTLLQQQMNAQMKEMQQKNPEAAKMTEEQQQALAKVTNKFMERAMNLNTPEEMLGDMTALYQKYMTRSDLDAIIAFYSSPAGQHMLTAQPAIMQEYLPLVIQRMQGRVKGLTEEMTKEMMEIAKPKPPAASKPVQK